MNLVLKESSSRLRFMTGTILSAATLLFKPPTVAFANMKLIRSSPSSSVTILKKVRRGSLASVSKAPTHLRETSSCLIINYRYHSFSPPFHLALVQKPRGPFAKFACRSSKTSNSIKSESRLNKPN